MAGERAEQHLLPRACGDGHGYIDSRSLWLDLKLLVLTALTIIRWRGRIDRPERGTSGLVASYYPKNFSASCREVQKKNLRFSGTLWPEKPISGSVPRFLLVAPAALAVLALRSRGTPVGAAAPIPAIQPTEGRVRADPASGNCCNPPARSALRSRHLPETQEFADRH